MRRLLMGEELPRGRRPNRRLATSRFATDEFRGWESAGTTQRGYRVAVSDCTSSSRSQKKAQTRARIVNAAQQLFAASGFEAVTITEIAAAAEVSVQTVFNHVASKEELFFAERAAWVEGPAEAIRTRPPGARLTDVLQRHFVRTVEGYARAATTDLRHRR